MTSKVSYHPSATAVRRLPPRAGRRGQEDREGHERDIRGKGPVRTAATGWSSGRSLLRHSQVQDGPILNDVGSGSATSFPQAWTERPAAASLLLLGVVLGVAKLDELEFGLKQVDLAVKGTELRGLGTVTAYGVDVASRGLLGQLALELG